MEKRIVIGVLLVAGMCLIVVAQVMAQPTPFVIAGYVSYVNGTACNDPNVEITNTNTSESWDAENASTSNYYQLVLTSEDVSAGAHLQINVSGCGQSKMAEHTVTQDEMEDGGIFEFNISLEAAPSNEFDTGQGTYPSISGTHYGKIIPDTNISVSTIYTYPCAGTGGHTEYAKIWNETTGECVVAEWDDYVGDYHNLSFNTTLTLREGIVYSYHIETGSYPQTIHAPYKQVTGGNITCTRFEDANGEKYEDWIPAIRLRYKFG